MAIVNSQETETMKAIIQEVYGGPEVLHFATVPRPTAGPRDILVRVKAVSVNPVDAKERSRGLANTPVPNPPKIVGWDGAGVVEALGLETTLFSLGDHVYFAGDRTRQGSYAEYVAVDERIVGHKPQSLSFEESVAIPLTALTAWEGLLETIEVKRGEGEQPRTLLIVGGAGGVGSIAIQIGKKVCDLHVVATASRKESEDFCRKMGADAVIDHNHDFVPQLNELGLDGVEYIFTTATLENFDQLVASLKPLGKICCILAAGGGENLDVSGLFPNRGTLAFELMFTRSSHDVEPEKQGQILNRVAELLDQKELVSTMTRVESWEAVETVHQAIETTHSVGKTVMRVE